MRSIDIIIKKRDKYELSSEEIDFFIQGYSRGEITDYQASAWAMAVLLNGMTPRETTDLTLSMARSGQILDLADIVDVVVDKHSTGGVGDKTTLAILPIVAACGLPCGKMSGRGLGFSGGTLDKLESIPGYRVNLSTEEFKQQLKEIGIVLTGQSLDLAPADGKFYALRDVTGTVQSIPLIASSIMSKKIASGATAILLDVKTGLGAFMQTLDEARELAETMISIGNLAGRKVQTLLSDMNQPLGFAVGNVLEIKEALDVLHGGGPMDFREHCLVACEHMLVLGGRAADLASARKLALAVVENGSAFTKFKQLVKAQGGDVSYVDQPEKMEMARFIESIASPTSGYIAQIHARLIGEAAVDLGAGRAKKGDQIDHAVGFLVLRKVGEYVQSGEPLCIVHANDPEKLNRAREAVLAAHSFSQTAIKPLPLFYD
jgi:pyrimidine-nucleoside phosphorylase